VIGEPSLAFSLSSSRYPHFKTKLTRMPDDRGDDHERRAQI